jgi:hypothetical protein
MVLNDAARDYANMKAQPAAVQQAVLQEIRNDRRALAGEYATLQAELGGPITAERRGEILGRQQAIQMQDQALRGSAVRQIQDMANAGLLNPIDQREWTEGLGEALGGARLGTGMKAPIGQRVDMLKGAVEEVKQVAADLKAAKIGNNVGRDEDLTTPAIGGAPQYNLKEAQLNAQAAKDVATVTAPIDFDHIIGADYKMNKNGTFKFDANGQAQPTGGHSLTNGDVRIKPGTESLPDAGGAYTAEVQIADPRNSGQWLDKNVATQTMFPKEWTEARIKVELDGAWNNRTATGNQWEGYTPSGVLVRGYLSPRVTAYPVYQAPPTPSPSAGGRP